MHSCSAVAPLNRNLLREDESPVAMRFVGLAVYLLAVQGMLNVRLWPLCSLQGMAGGIIPSLCWSLQATWLAVSRWPCLSADTENLDCTVVIGI